MNPKNFFAELKRRNVYKVAIAYGVVAWLLMQVASQIFPFFEIPNWAVRLVVLLLIIGFPVAVILAWAFELTPEGIKRAEVADEEPVKHTIHRTWIHVVVTTGLISLGFFFLGCYTAWPRNAESSELPAKSRHTAVSITGDEFRINGEPTYAGRRWNGHKIQGLLLNSRMVQGIFDDLNTNTVSRWAYPDTGEWDPERNTREFIAAMPQWRKHGLLAFTINLQGGSPEGYSKDQPWNNSAIVEDGSLRANYMKRLERIIDRADELGMVVILGYFYFGQDERLRDEAAVIRATDNATQWVFDHGYRNVLVEIDNDCNDVRYDHAILQSERVHELIERVKKATRNGGSLLVSTSYLGGTIPKENVVRAADFLLIHGNGISNPNQISDMVRKTRVVPGYRGVPIVFNEDDHFDFEKPLNNFIAAVREHVSWGYFDFRMKDEGFDEGYQSVPVNWGISSARKRGFFKLLSQITGGQK